MEKIILNLFSDPNFVYKNLLFFNSRICRAKGKLKIGCFSSLYHGGNLYLFFIYSCCFFLDISKTRQQVAEGGIVHHINVICHLLTDL